MTEVQARKIFGMLCAGWPRAMRPEHAEPSCEVYCAGIRDMGIDDVLRGIAHLVKTSRFLPSVAEIREATELCRPKVAALPAAKSWAAAEREEFAVWAHEIVSALGQNIARPNSRRDLDEDWAHAVCEKHNPVG